MADIRNTMFYHNISRALAWLFETQDEDSYGWSWIRDISPNSQNTAEAVSVSVKFADYLDENQREFVNAAVEGWLLDPSMTGVIVVDYAWILRALTVYGEKYDLFAPDFSLEEVTLAAAKCLELLLYAQNEDGGWGESRGETTTAIRTALVVYCIMTYTESYGSTESSRAALIRAKEWLLKNQNSDGGWGNQTRLSVAREFRGQEAELSSDLISGQFLSNPAVTGYVLLALGSAWPYECYHEITAGIGYLEKHQEENGSFGMFYEVGMRGDVRFTYRHFGTAWALKGLMVQRRFREDDLTIVRGIGYLMHLQDEASGAWKCTPESDVYTWSTCNALSVLYSMLTVQNRILEFQYRTVLDRLWTMHMVGAGHEQDKKDFQGNDRKTAGDSEKKEENAGQQHCLLKWCAKEKSAAKQNSAKQDPEKQKVRKKKKLPISAAAAAGFAAGGFMAAVCGNLVHGIQKDKSKDRI